MHSTASASPLSPASEGALATIRRVLPASLRESLHTTEEVIALEPGPWVVFTRPESLLAAASAIRSNRRIRFANQSHNDVTSHREVEPYAVLHADDRRYLIGRCLSRQALRTFRLDRVTHLELCTAIFQPPPDFDAQRYLVESMPFVQSRFEIDVWIDMPPAEAKRNFALWRVAIEPDNEGTRLRCGRDTLECSPPCA